MADITTDVIPNAQYALNALTTADLADHWSITQLYEWADEAGNTLAQDRGLLVETNILTGVAFPFAIDQTLLELPPEYLAMIWLGLTTGLRLTPTTVREVEALDDDWDASESEQPMRWIGDEQRSNWLKLYPIPLNPGALTLIYMQTSPPLNADATEFPLPDPLVDVLTLHMIAEARRIETDAQMPEVVTFAEGLLGLYSSVMDSYFGGGI